MTSFGRSCVPAIIRITGYTPGFRREADNLLETKIGRVDTHQERSVRSGQLYNSVPSGAGSNFNEENQSSDPTAGAGDY